MQTGPASAAQKILCVIPVYNNAGSIRDVIRGCLAHLPDVCIVDDASTDANLPEQLADAGVTVIRHDRNRGKGAALLTALAHAAAHDFDHIITIDGDGQHAPADIPKFITAIREHPDAVIIGHRDFNTANVPGSSRFGRAFSNFWIRLETGVDAGDSQSGFRAYPVAHMRQLPLRGSRYEFEMEVIAQAAWAGLPILTVPVEVTYFPPGESRSSFHPFLDNVRISLMHTRLVGRRLVPWPHRRLLKPRIHPLDFLLHPKTFMVSLLRESATPGGLAASAAVGVFLASLPLVGFHTIIIVYVASRLNLNRLIAVIVSNLCMPPLVPALCIEVGYYMRHGSWLTEMSRQTLLHEMHHRVWEWLLGSFIVGPVLAGIVALLIFAMAIAWRRQKERTNG